MRSLLVVTAATLALAACSDREDDVVQTPADGGPAQTVTEAQASATESAAAFAYGLTREQLDDSDVLSAQNADLGDVDGFVIDAAGALTGVVVELEGPGDVKVVVPKDDLRSIMQAGEYDVTTDLTAAQLAALPKWTPPAR